jgi:hypothetical protein
MSRHYLSHDERDRSAWSLPTLLVEHQTHADALAALDDDARTRAEADGDDLAGFYWCVCVPGCLPDSDTFGPYQTEAEAVHEARLFLMGGDDWADEAAEADACNAAMRRDPHRLGEEVRRA